MLGKDHLTHHLRSLLGNDRVKRVDFAPSLDLRHGMGEQWWRMTSDVTLEALKSPQGLATNPMLTTPLAAMVMTGLLLAADHPYRDALDAWGPPAPRSLVSRATDFIEQRAQEPLTVAAVAEAAGCGVRTLQNSFRTHLNTTPSEYIKRVRLDRAHSMLRTATPDITNVATIASTWGFNPISAFETEYFNVYGVSPQETLHGE